MSDYYATNPGGIAGVFPAGSARRTTLVGRQVLVSRGFYRGARGTVLIVYAAERGNAHAGYRVGDLVANLRTRNGALCNVPVTVLEPAS